jgi:hypothetical protein
MIQSTGFASNHFPHLGQALSWLLLCTVLDFRASGSFVDFSLGIRCSVHEARDGNRPVGLTLIKS